jgi:hypothetical protein
MPANENRLITVRCDDYAKRYTENLLLIVESVEELVNEDKKA